MGEFTYLVEGTATPPAISNHLTWTAKTNSTAMKAIPLHHQNSMREKAILAAMMAGGYEQRAATAQDMTGVIRSSTMSLADGMNSKKGENGKTTNAGIVLEQNTHQLTPKIPIRYTVTYSSPFFNGPSEVVITPPTEPKVKDRRIGAIMPLENKVQELIATFRPKVRWRWAGGVNNALLHSLIVHRNLVSTRA